MSKKDTFCVLPWMHLATVSSGNLRVCCNSTPGKNLIRREDKTPYKIFRDDIKDAWNSDTYKTIRKQMLDGERPDMCVRCFREEDAGLSSARMNWNRRWKTDEEYSATPEMNIKYVDLRLGNLCNLKCRMCNPYSSNQWVKEWSLIEDALSESEYERLKNMDWPENPKTWDNLFLLDHTIEEIYLTGGEPTLIKQQHILLSHLVEKGLASKIRLKYNINVTNIPNHLIEVWQHFKRVQLNCSIDAVGELNHYIRYPSNWDKIDENLTKVIQLPNVKCEIHTTVQMYNILNLHEMLAYAKSKDMRCYLNILNHPEYFNIRVLPKPLKEEVKERLTNFIDVEKVSGVIAYMEAEDWSERMQKFVDATVALDISRSESIVELVPEFAAYFPTDERT